MSPPANFCSLHLFSVVPSQNEADSNWITSGTSADRTISINYEFLQNLSDYFQVESNQTRWRGSTLNDDYRCYQRNIHWLHNPWIMYQPPSTILYWPVNHHCSSLILSSNLWFLWLQQAAFMLWIHKEGDKKLVNYGIKTQEIKTRGDQWKCFIAQVRRQLAQVVSTGTSKCHWHFLNPQFLSSVLRG